MCTRFSFAVPKEKMKRQFNLAIKEEELQYSYNIGAGSNAYVLTNTSLELQIFRWGLIPHWANDANVGLNLINATAETISGQLSFRMPVRQNRCLVFADSFYEWKKIGRQSQPYRVLMEDASNIAFAGVWDMWLDENKQVFKTFSIVTVPANEEMQAFGTRMPMILRTGAEQVRWLTEASLQTVLNILKPLPNHSLKYYPISKAIDVPENNFPELHQPVELSLEELELWEPKIK